ncbi:MAG: beta-propeller domain-containing protein [Sandaracinaceae bacterium]|nr:beta-propeller domain-containing protein [Sandaracinaceae bacterium]
MLRRRPWIGLALAALGAAGIAFGLALAVGGDDYTGWDSPPDPRAVALVRGVTASRIEAFGTGDAFDAYVERLGRAASIQHRVDEAARAARVELLSFAEPEAEEAAADAPSSTGAESVTNNQEAGVDEGGIVKAHGDHLVILRHGRLFSAQLEADGSITPISRADAYPPGVTGGWYDEMLISGDTIVVIGYRYGSSGTEIGRFHIDGEGQIERVDTHFLTSDDYFSSRNYASRLIGQTLIFYMPYALLRPEYDGDEASMQVQLPGIRPDDGAAWDTILDSEEILRPVQPTIHPVLHTVVRCDLSQPELRCTARGVLGPAGRSFYVSREAVYVWVGSDRWGTAAGDERAVVYRMPLDGSAPIGAVRVAGTPIDQLAFREADGWLNVLVRSDGSGDAMWGAEAEASGSALALWRLPAAAFTDGVTDAPRGAFTLLPAVEGWSLHVRHVGDHVLYGAASSRWERDRARDLVVHPVAGGETAQIHLPHGVDRIDVLGDRAVAIGGAEDGLHFTAVDLGSEPRVVGAYVRAGVVESESRSHGFFYSMDGPEGGTLGLPIIQEGRNGWEPGSGAVLYLRVADGDAVDFTPLGTLDASAHVTEDHCVASCADWYGDARPLFYRGLVYALLGYELVHGRVEDGAMREVTRANLYEDQGRRVAE